MFHHDNKETEAPIAKHVDVQPMPRHPEDKNISVKNFAAWVESEIAVKMNMINMIIQHSTKADSSYEIETYVDFFRILDETISKSPMFGHSLVRSCPLSSLMWDFRLCSESVEFLRNKTVNDHFREILKAWCTYLNSPESRDCLNTGPTGFLCPKALELMNYSEYEMDLSKPYAGLSSFNHFFSRSIKPECRPIASIDDDSVVIAPCDSRPDQISKNVYESSYFWIKKGLYSLNELLGNSQYKSSFIGGTAIQSYLNPFDYHGWHFPVSGTILEIQQLEGFYFAVPDVATGNTDDLWYLSHINARAIVIIQADHEPLGKVALINVGMSEVSSCLIYPEVVVGKKIKKGEKIGTFQFGGSTFCLLFEPNTLQNIYIEEEDDKVGFKKIKMGEAIARGVQKP